MTATRGPFAPSHILVPVALAPEDEVSYARCAIVAAERLAGALGARVTLLAVGPWMGAAPASAPWLGDETYGAMRRVLEARAEHIRAGLEELRREASELGPEPSVEYVAESTGGVGERICDAAARLGADMIVMATHARRGLHRLLLGSTAARVSHATHLPLLLVRPDGEPKDSQPHAHGGTA